MKRLLTTTALVTLLGAFGVGGVALADSDGADESCTVPEAEWRPQAELQQQLEADGWADIAIEVDDGCYEVEAIDADGQAMELEFDPQTFALLDQESADEDDDDDEDEDDREDGDDDT